MSLTKQLKNICIIQLGILLLVLSFGDYLKLAGISLSWIVAIVVLIFLFFHILICGKVELISKKKRYNTVLYFFIFWLIYMFVQGLWVKDMELWRSGVFSNLVNILLIFEIWYLLKNDADIKFFLRFSVPLWILNAFLGLYEIFTRNFFIQEGVSYWDTECVRTFFVNPNDCATWFVLVFLLLACYLNIYGKKKIHIFIAWAMTAFVVYHTNSRACLIAVISYPVIYLFGIFVIKISAKINILLRFFFWCIGILGIGFLFVSLYSGGLMSIINEFSGIGNKESDIFRLVLIKDAIQTIVNSAFMGVGANQTITYISTNPHNFLLELFSDFGFLVFGITCHFLIKIINEFFNREAPVRKRAYALSTTITFLLISISSSSINRLRLTWVLIIVLYLSIESNKGHIERS